jgi:hypothetical protein
MPTCPDGHNSTDPDFCDVCGMRIGGAPAAAVAASGAASAPGTASAGAVPADAGPAPASAPAAPDAAAEPCPQCGAARSGQFCETCGYDFVTGKAMSTGPTSAPAKTESGPIPAPGGDGARPGDTAAWTAVVSADRAYYDSVIAEGGPDADSIEFPGYCPERRFRLSGQEMRIGRRSISRGLEPEIDLTGPPTDPGVSHLHAVLIAQTDGSWVVLDPGSANGTVVNGGEIPGGVQVPLHDGDRICVGAWTVLTIQAPSTP